MLAFVHLIERLDRCRGTSERVETLADYFAAADPRDAAWALRVLLAKRRKRLITGRRLRQICLEACGLPEWLFDACHSQVGDSAETIALLWPGEAAAESSPQTAEPGNAAEPAGASVRSSSGVTSPVEGMATPGPSAGEPVSAANQPLHHWMEQLLPAAAALEGEPQAVAVRDLWRGLEPQQLLVANKLLTGGLRVGVAQGLVVRALARLSGLEEALLMHRLMGEQPPTAAAWQALLAPAESVQQVPSRPYPFFLASPLPSDMDAESPLEGPAKDWLAEWKWDGIRGQLIQRPGGTFLWSRGEELIQDAFPEVLQAAADLPPGTVLDGELLVWPGGEPCPAPFAQLQRRLGRRRPGRRLLQECPVVLLAYDLLERDGEDIRGWPLIRRRAALEALLQQVPYATASPAAGVLSLSPRLSLSPSLSLSPLLPLRQWSELEPLRQRAEAAGAEGLMLKRAESPYLAGRRRGHWWKHKRDPYLLDAVLLYAQAGSGRRATLFTDYTFGLWNRPPDGNGPSGRPAASGAAGSPVDNLEGAMDDDDPNRQALAGAPTQLVTFAKAYSGLDDAEILELDRWIRSHTTERFGPVRAVQPLQVFELAFEGLQRSGRHKSGIAVRFPRIHRWRRDKQAHEADTLDHALALLERAEPSDIRRLGS